MKKKIRRVILLLVDGILLFICVLILLQTLYIQRQVIRASRETGEKVEQTAGAAMNRQAEELLHKTSLAGAQTSDEELSDFLRAIRMIAENAEDLYLSPGKYGSAELKTFDEGDRGTLAVYAAYSGSTDPDSFGIKKELALIANMQGMLLSLNRANVSMAADYFATESGIFLAAEEVSDYNLSKDGEVLRLEAKERPWYQMAVETGGPVFTGIIPDVDTGEPVITCGVPVYVNGAFKGVAGAGMHLDAVREDVTAFRVGENGYACILNDQGQILFSGADEGELAAAEDMSEDLRNSSNTALADFAKDAIDGKSEIRLIKVNGTDYYAACSPMETTKWSYLVVLPKAEVSQPAADLIDSLSISKERQEDLTKSAIVASICLLLFLMVFIGVIATVISERLSKKLAGPVVELTEKVRSMEGDKLDFSWDTDTNDEVQVLAESFGSMTERMKRYIKDITEITAEKERIDAELNVATKIQASMLPCVFPPFPERNDFDIYASMTPAKEVGGDFYDFFLVDNDHLALVIADVSGKGVPAALFMVVTKTLMKNHAKTGKSPEEVLVHTNNRLLEGNGGGLFVTAWIGVIDLRNGKLSFSEAGHDNPYLIHQDGTVEMIRPVKKKLPVAAFENTQYLINEIVLTKGDTVFLYTDGVPEATDANDQMYTTDRLESALKDNHDAVPKTLLEAVRKDVDGFVGSAPQFDDLTMLAFRFLG